MIKRSLGELASNWPAAVGGAIAVALSILLRSLFDTKLLAEVVVDATTDLLQPEGFSFFLRLFDAAGKPLLFATILVGEVFVFIFAWRAFDRLAPSRQAVAAGVLAACAFLAGTVALVLLTASDLGSRTGWPEYVAVTLFCCLIYAIAAAMLEEMESWSRGAAPEQIRDDSRRTLIARGGALLVGGMAVYIIGRQVLNSTGGGVQVSRQRGVPTLPVTSNEDFYVISKNFIDPEPSASKWTLRVGGVVSQPLQLSYDDVRNLPSIEQYTTMQCISNTVGGDLISTALWRGIPMATLIEMVKPAADARWVAFRCEDDYIESVDINFAMADGVLLAYDMNGVPLPSKHGFPLRMLSPGKYGMKHPKWINQISIQTDESVGYWKERGWDAELMKTSSRIDVPASGTTLTADIATQRVQGLAYSGRRGIRRVEVSVDNGETWNDATLEAPISPYTWVLWSYDWTDIPRSGATIIQARATDGEGQVQTAKDADPYPSGATGYPYASIGFPDVK